MESERRDARRHRNQFKPSLDTSTRNLRRVFKRFDADGVRHCSIPRSLHPFAFEALPHFTPALCCGAWHRTGE
jgi:hypothetical protein